jgi:hypothetical protein
MKNIDKGQNPVKIPFPIRSNSRVMAQWCNEVRTCLLQLRDRVPRVKKTPKRKQIYTSTIVPQRIFADEGQWKVIFTLAKFWEHSLHEPGKEHRIAAGGGHLDEEDPQVEVPLEEGNNEIWLKFGVTKEGKIAADSVELEIGVKPDSNPMLPLRPPEEDDGTTPSGLDGIHVQKIGTIEIPAAPNEENKPVKWKPECTSAKLDIFSPGIEFVGDGQRLYRTYDGELSIDKWRTIKNGDEPDSGGSDAGDTVNFLLEPASESEEIGDSLVIARLAEKSSEPQVRVSQVGSGMSAINLVRGNGKNGKLTFLDPDGNVGFELEWKDGLIINEGLQEYTDQTGGGSSSGSGGNMGP